MRKIASAIVLAGIALATVLAAGLAHAAEGPGIAAGETVHVIQACDGAGHRRIMDAIRRRGIKAAPAAFETEEKAGHCASFERPVPVVVLDVFLPVRAGSAVIHTIRIGDDLFTAHVAEIPGADA